MRRLLGWTVLVACLVVAPLGGADWVTHSGSNQRDGWQRNETKISKDTLKDLKLLWKIRLETKQRSVYSLYGPLIVERSITDRGFKEIAFVAGANNDLFAVDADLGKLLWQKHFDWHAEIPETEQASFLCPGGLTAWPVLQPPPARGRGPGGPPPPAARGAAPAAPAPQRGGGGPFAIRPIYVLSGDGDLHAVNINTGDDLVSPLKFLPPNGKPYSLAYVDSVIYTITGQGCGGNPNSVYSLDLNDPVGPAAALYSMEFFQQLRTALAPGGALALHLGSPVAQPQRVADLAQRLNSVFRIVRVYTMYIPLYGSLWSMAVCSDKLDPKAFTADEIDRRIEARKLQELRYYNGETHEGVFALPNFVRDLVTPARLKQPARGRRLGVVRAASK